MIPQDILKKVRQIEIRTNRTVDSILGGEYHSAFKGRGMEFEEVREYQPGDDIRQIDREVILARSDVTVTNSRSGHYQSRVEVSLIGNALVEIPRGWVMADVIVEDQGLRFVSTHLEVGRFRDIQVAQAAELVALFPTDTRTILLGDINSSPSTPAP